MLTHTQRLKREGQELLSKSRVWRDMAFELTLFFNNCYV